MKAAALHRRRGSRVRGCHAPARRSSWPVAATAREFAAYSHLHWRPIIEKVSHWTIPTLAMADNGRQNAITTRCWASSGRPPTRRLPTPIASWRSSTIPTRTRATTRPSSASRRPPRPSRCSATAKSGAATTASAMRGFEGAGRGQQFNDVNDIFAAFGDIFGDSAFGDLFGGAAAAACNKGADVRCDVTLDLLEAARGVTKTIEFQRHEVCADCQGTGAKPGSTPHQAAATAAAAARWCSRTGIFRVQTTCPSCHGAGSIVKDPCPKCRAAGYVLATRAPRRADSRRHRRPDARAAARRGRAQPQRRPPRRLLLLHHGQGASAVPARGAAPDRPRADHLFAGGAGRQDRGAHARRPARAEGSRRHAVGRSVQAARRGMPSPRGRGVGDLLVQVNIEVPKSLSPRRTSCCASWPRRNTPTSARTARASSRKCVNTSAR